MIKKSKAAIVKPIETENIIKIIDEVKNRQQNQWKTIVDKWKLQQSNATTKGL
tara:strand:- start:597 stop:755 length:159 start_codon:yes stop_codon:yes gene_type:complete